MIALTALVLSFTGFAAIALSMRRHHQDVLGTPPGRSRKLVLGMAGWLLLGASIWPAIAADGVSVGITFWFGVIALAALIVAMSLTYGPGAVRTLSRQSGRDASLHHERSNDETKRHAAVVMAAMSSERRK